MSQSRPMNGYVFSNRFRRSVRKSAVRNPSGLIHHSAYFYGCSSSHRYGREAIWNMLLIGSPVLLAGMVVGSDRFIAALRKSRRQTVAFVPKLIAMVLVLSLALPWLIAAWCSIPPT